MPTQVADTNLVETSAGEVILKPINAEIDNVNGDSPSSPMVPEEGVSSVLETIEERRARRRSHYVVYITTFVMSIGFSIVLTGVWPYLHQLDGSVSKEFLGWVVAANPLGQMLASPAFGLWANKAGSNRGAMLVTIFFFIIGNILYAILSLFGSAARSVMIFSRLVVGVSSANVAIIRSYIAASTTMKERTAALSLISAAQGLGFIFGPAIQTGLVALMKSDSSDIGDDVVDNSPSANQNSSAIQTAIALGFSKDKEALNSTSTESFELEDSGPRIEWDMYTATGWFAAILGLINIVLYLPCIYQEHPIAAKEAQFMKRAANGDALEIPKPDYLMLFVVLKTFFLILTIYVLLETLMVPMTMDLYAWTDEKAITVIGIGLSIAGLLSIVMFGGVGFLSKKFDERKVLIFLGLIPILLATICFFPMGSTYPKIKNCTAEAESVEFTTSSPKNTQEMTTQLFVDDPAVNEDAVTLSNAMNDLKDSDNNIGLFIANGNHLSNTTLSRRKRYVASDGDCLDLGCPVEQVWCQYTPIIELPQLGIACFVAIIGYPVAFALCSAFFSKLLGPKPQGVWMGVLTSTGSFSRVVGPIFVSYMYTTLGTRWMFGLLFVILSINLLTVVVFFKRLVPMKVTVS